MIRSLCRARTEALSRSGSKKNGRVANRESTKIACESRSRSACHYKKRSIGARLGPCMSVCDQPSQRLVKQAFSSDSAQPAVYLHTF